MAVRFPPFSRSAKPSENGIWLEVQRIEDALHGTWGLGGDEKGQGYRNRLRRLCDFLRELEPESAGTADRNADLAKLKRGLAQPQSFTGAREGHICRLMDLRRALEALAPAHGTEGSRYWAPGEGWTPGDSLPMERQSSRERALVALGALPANPELRDQTARGQLGALSDLLARLETGAIDAAAKERVKKARARWQECLDDCASDWEWAWVQVLVRLARECLRDQPFHPQCCVHAKTAKEALEKAIEKLERNGFNQYRAQGLYGILAATCLMVGRARDTEPEKRLQEIKSALVYARHAVALEPESSRERLVLLDVLSVLGDPEDIRVQAEIALDLDSGPDTLRTIGESYWGRAAILRGRGVRRKLLREAAGFFAKALENVDSAPLDERGPLDQIEAHAWAHFWLGRFHGELGRFSSASAHLQTACTLGFKPLEARVELAWTCLLAHDRKHADQAFREAIEEAERRRVAGPVVAAAPGEKRPVAELAFEGYLGWAFLCADWDPDRAMENAQRAEDRLASIGRANDPQLRAAVLEVRGRVALRRRKLREGLDLLEESVRMSPGSGAYCALGLANLARGQVTGKATLKALHRAREAYYLGRDCDIRGRHRRELWELRRELAKQGELRKPQERWKPEHEHQATAAQPNPETPATPTANGEINP